MFPDPPKCSFASDNAAGIHPAVLDAIAAANLGHALAYGEDDWTRQVEGEFNDLFGREVSVLLALNGTGTNILALATMLQPGESVLCTDWSHINDDEAAAPERVLSTKLISTPSVDGKMSVDSIHARAEALGNIHHAQPGILSITQATEWGTTYSVDEIGELCEVAHSYGMRVHLDGARIANAVAALGSGREGLRKMVVETGVDTYVLRNEERADGCRGGYSSHALPETIGAAPPQTGQSTGIKDALCRCPVSRRPHDDQWLAWASHANAMAQQLHSGA